MSVWGPLTGSSPITVWPERLSRGTRCWPSQPEWPVRRMFILEPRVRQGFLLAGRERVEVEAVDQTLEQAMPVDRGAQVDEHRTQPDRGAIHEHELARRPHAAHAPQLAEHVLRH